MKTLIFILSLLTGNLYAQEDYFNKVKNAITNKNPYYLYDKNKDGSTRKDVKNESPVFSYTISCEMQNFHSGSISFRDVKVSTMIQAEKDDGTFMFFPVEKCIIEQTRKKTWKDSK